MQPFKSTRSRLSASAQQQRAQAQQSRPPQQEQQQQQLQPQHEEQQQQEQEALSPQSSVRSAPQRSQAEGAAAAAGGGAPIRPPPRPPRLGGPAGSLSDPIVSQLPKRRESSSSVGMSISASSSGTEGSGGGGGGGSHRAAPPGRITSDSYESSNSNSSTTADRKASSSSSLSGIGVGTSNPATPTLRSASRGRARAGSLMGGYYYTAEKMPRHLKLYHPPRGIAAIGNEQHALLGESHFAVSTSTSGKGLAQGGSTSDPTRAQTPKNLPSLAPLSPRSPRPQDSSQDNDDDLGPSPTSTIHTSSSSGNIGSGNNANPSLSAATSAAQRGQAPSFTFVCLGVGGGPLESDCSCYLLKPGDARWEDGCILVEGGSFLGALAKVCAQPEIRRDSVAPGPHDGPPSSPFFPIGGEDVQQQEDDRYGLPGPAFRGINFPFSDPALRAGLIGSFTKGFLISHAHLDHICGLVLGCASLPGKKAVWGLKPTLENIMQLFDGKIWPKLASWDNEEEGFSVYRLKSLEPEKSTFLLDDHLSVIPFPLSHGLSPNEQPPAPPTPAGVVYSSRGASLPGHGPVSKRYSLPLSEHFSLLGLRNSSTGHDIGLFGTGSVGKTIAGAGGAVSFEAQMAAAGEKLIFTSPFVPAESRRGDRDAAQPRGSKNLLDLVSTMEENGESVVQLEDGTLTRSGAPGSDDSSSPPPEASSGGVRLGLSEKMSIRLGVGGQPLRKISRRPATAQGSEHSSAQRRNAVLGQSKLAMNLESPDGVEDSETSPGTSSPAPSTPGLPPDTSQAGTTGNTGSRGAADASKKIKVPEVSPPALDSSAFFITNEKTGKDVLFFGDVEPDSISQYPRNLHVWRHAAARYVQGALNAVFLECSFPAAHPTRFLYGHLSVGHLFEEMKAFARCVLIERKKVESALHRKRLLQEGVTRRTVNGIGNSLDPQAEQVLGGATGRSGGSGLMERIAHIPQIPPSAASAQQFSDADLRGALEGVTVVIIHIKTALFPSFEAQPKEETTESERRQSSGQSGSTGAAAPRKVDPRRMQQRILEELRETEGELQLGLRIELAEQGQRIEC